MKNFDRSHPYKQLSINIKVPEVRRDDKTNKNTN